MVEGEVTREGEPISHHRKPLPRGTSMQAAIQIIFTLTQRPMDVVSN